MADDGGTKREWDVDYAVRLVSGPPEKFYHSLKAKEIIEMNRFMPLEPWKDIGASNSGIEVKGNRVKIQITERPERQAYAGDWLAYGDEMGLCALWWPKGVRELEFHYFPRVKLYAIVNEVDYEFEINIYDQTELWRKIYSDILEDRIVIQKPNLYVSLNNLENWKLI